MPTLEVYAGNSIGAWTVRIAGWWDTHRNAYTPGFYQNQLSTQDLTTRQQFGISGANNHWVPFWGFDTSDIPEHAHIISATLDLDFLTVLSTQDFTGYFIEIIEWGSSTLNLITESVDNTEDHTGNDDWVRGDLTGHPQGIIVDSFLSTLINSIDTYQFGFGPTALAAIKKGPGAHTDMHMVSSFHYTPDIGFPGFPIDSVGTIATPAHATEVGPKLTVEYIESGLELGTLF